MMNYNTPRVSELLNLFPIVCDAEMSALDAARLMSEKGVGSILVLEEKFPIGIVTERDLVTKLIAKKMDPSKTKLSTIMSGPVITINPNADIVKASEIMSKNKIRRLPVVSENMLVGIITDRDILRVSPNIMATAESFKDFVCREDPVAVETAGYCEGCGSYSNELSSMDGRLLCRECTELGE